MLWPIIKQNQRGYPVLSRELEGKPSLADLNYDALTHVITALLKHNLATGYNLSLTCRFFFDEMQEPLAKYIPQLVIEANHAHSEERQKLRAVVGTARRNPAMLFHSVKMMTEDNAIVETNAVRVALDICDLYLIELFLSLSIKIDQLDKYSNEINAHNLSSAAKQVIIPEGADEELIRSYVLYYDMENDYTLFPLANTYLQLTRVMNDAIANELFLDSKPELNKMLITGIGSAQKQLPRWMRDEMLRGFNAWATEEDFSDVTPLTECTFPFRNDQIDPFAFDAGAKLGEHFALAGDTGFGDGMCVEAIEQRPIIENDLAGWCRLYKSRVERRAELIALVQEEVKLQVH
jgi:hypothetical protein